MIDYEIDRDERFDYARGLAKPRRRGAHGGEIDQQRYSGEVLQQHARGEFLQGIGNVEAAYYDSLDDRKGTDPLTDNSQLRFLAGYTREVAADLTAGVQYNLERMIDHENYANRLPEGSVRKIQDRQVTTLRLTRLALQQNLRLSLFVFYSPSDADAHLRPNVHYKINDLWSVSAGSNIFPAEKNLSFFGQLEDNTNVYGRVRYSF